MYAESTYIVQMYRFVTHVAYSTETNKKLKAESLAIVTKAFLGLPERK